MLLQKCAHVILFSECKQNYGYHINAAVTNGHWDVCVCVCYIHKCVQIGVIYFLINFQVSTRLSSTTAQFIGVSFASESYLVIQSSAKVGYHDDATNESFFRVTGLCAGKSPVTGGFLPQWASDADLTFVSLSPHSLLNKQWNERWFETT